MIRILFSLLLILSFFSATASEHEPSSTYLQYGDSADYYLKKQDWIKSEKYIIDALRTEPANKSNYILWSNLGTVRMELDNIEGALQAFEIALTSVPKSKTILTNRARTYLKANRVKEALDDLENVLMLDSVAEFPLRMTAALALQNGNFDLAEKRYKLLSLHYTDNNSGLLGLANLSQVKGDFDQAEKYFKEASAIEPLDEESESQYIYTIIQNNKIPEAKEEIRLALEKYPRNGNLYLMRGLVHHLQFQTDLEKIDRKLALEYGADPELVNQILPIRKK